MIYTVTFNPAIDYVVYLEKLHQGSINRAERETVFFGGKGINVSLILRELGVASTATGFLAGFTGSAIDKGIGGGGLQSDFVFLETGLTRINVKIRSGVETDINGQGPMIGDGDVERLFQKLSGLQAGDILVLAGSIPSTLPTDIYETILESLSGHGVRFVVDATQDLLLNALKYRPFLIKPNREELGELFGVQLQTTAQVAQYARRLRTQGAINVLVSMGSDGALLLDEFGQEHYRKAISGKSVNTVGAGDSMVAGFIAGYLGSGDYDYALRLGTAAGGATAFSEGLAKRDQILRLLEEQPATKS